MRLALRKRAELQGLSPDLVGELEQLIARLNQILPLVSQTTVGSAGSASALPATPTGYFTITINGTERAVPYYAKS